MKRLSVALSFVLVAFMLSGCIISKSPTSDHVSLSPGGQQTFSVNVFPSETYVWTLDGNTLSETGSSYLYTATEGDHTLNVTAKHAQGKDDTAVWYIHVTDPISALLNSMVTIPGGSFQMGGTRYSYEQPVHTVTLSGFYLGATEVTQAQYLAVMGTNPSRFQGAFYPGCENYPVEQVTWYEARQFCAQLSAMTGRTFTLPSEAQWEYACRAGSTTLFSFGDDDALLGDYAWWGDNSYDSFGHAIGTHRVGTKLSNPWGLYDMHGNVEEWCLDSWHSNYTGAPTDGSAWEPDTGWKRVLRGGSWRNGEWDCRSCNRSDDVPGGRVDCVGFRVLAVR